MNTEEVPKFTKKVHHGRNVKRLREIMGIKQEVLADGLNVSQQKISRLESQEELDNDTLDKISNVLNIPVDAIKNYSDDIAANIISNTFNEQSTAYQHNVNPIEKIMQLYDEKEELLERLLKTEKEKNALFEKILENNQQ